MNITRIISSFFSCIIIILICTSNIAYTQQKTSFEQNLVLVEGGSFLMGQSDPNVACAGCTKDEQPKHKVTLGTFYISKYEITELEWEAIMGDKPSYDEGCDNCPVDGVSWNDVQLFIKKLNEKTGLKFRLPTEAEWEFAARGGNKSKGFVFSGSNNYQDVAWCSLKSDKRKRPVGQKQANELGIFDMSGNVWEWCSDFYDSKYYAECPAVNPTGPDSGKDRVLRGGSWYNQSNDSRVTARYRFFPSFRTNANGFRLVLDEKK